jgi:phosphoglycerate dehydrogenase-like enzyme
MARRATGFGMRLLACDPYVSPPVAGLPEIRSVDRDTLVAESDFLSLHCVLTPETRGIIGRRELAAMKPTAALINVSRGALVDETALVEALRDRRLAGAGLDVFVREPLAPDHPLLACDNAIVTPHFAFYSREAYQRLEAECLQAAERLLAGQRPRNIRNELPAG